MREFIDKQFDKVLISVLLVFVCLVLLFLNSYEDSPLLKEMVQFFSTTASTLAGALVMKINSREPQVTQPPQVPQIPQLPQLPPVVAVVKPDAPAEEAVVLKTLEPKP